MSPSPKTLTVMESNALLDALLVDTGTYLQRRKGIRNYLMGLLMLDAGLRVGEVVGLTIGDLYFNGAPVQSLRIPANVAKNNTERTVPLSQRIRKAIQAAENNFWVGLVDHPDSNAFGTTLGMNKLTTRQVERIVRLSGMRALGRPVHPHQLRHTFASRLMRTVNARIVQELLGHKNLSSTQIYTHPNSEDLRKAIDGIDVPTTVTENGEFTLHF